MNKKIPIKPEVKEALAVFAQKGGAATLKKHGKKHYRDMAKKSWLNRGKSPTKEKAIIK